MKWNKISLNKTVKNSKINFIFVSKYFLGTLALLLLSAIIIISAIGIRLGFDYVGGTIIEAVYDVEADGGTTYSEQDAKNIIETAIFDYKLQVSSYTTEESTFGDRVIYKLTAANRLSDERLADLKDDLYTMFGSYDEENILHAQYIKVYNVGGTADNIATYSAIALSVVIVLFAIGILIRYGLSQAIAAFIVSFINILMVFSFVIICRIPIDISFIASVFSVFLLTVINSLIFFDKTRENAKREDCKGFTKNEHSNLALRECFNIFFLIFVISLISMILISGLGVIAIRTFGLPVLFGVIINYFSMYLVLTYFWTIITFRKKRRRK